MVSYHATPFAPPGFCLIPQTLLAVALVEGCGADAIRRLVFRCLHGVAQADAADARKAVGRDASSPLLVGSPEVASRSDGTVVVAPWRHPVERFAAWQASVGHPGQRTLYHDFHALRARDWSRLLAYVAWELGMDDPAGTDDCVRPQADAYDPSCLDHLSRGAATTATAAAPRGVRSGALRRVRDAAASVGACSALISAAMRSA